MKGSMRAEAQASAFHAATKDGNLALVEFLLEDGIGVDVKNADGRTALSIAAEQGSDPIVRRLLEHGADPALKSAKFSNSWTNKFYGEKLHCTGQLTMDMLAALGFCWVTAPTQTRATTHVGLQSRRQP